MRSRVAMEHTVSTHIAKQYLNNHVEIAVPYDVFRDPPCEFYTEALSWQLELSIMRRDAGSPEAYRTIRLTKRVMKVMEVMNVMDMYR